MKDRIGVHIEPSRCPDEFGAKLETSVRRARFDEEQNRVLVLMKCDAEPDARDLCYSVRIRQGN